MTIVASYLVFKYCVINFYFNHMKSQHTIKNKHVVIGSELASETFADKTFQPII